jgi:hypothetical protein
MDRREQRILVTQAAPGMVLARPVLLPDRMVLVGEGAELSEQLISQLMTRGIKRIVVRGHPFAGSNTVDWDERVRQLDERFSRVRSTPFMSALRDVVARVMARRS